MPNVRSAKKRVKVTEVKRLRNVSAKSRIKTYIKKFEAAAQQGDKEAATSLYRQTSSLLDKAAAKGIIHKNTANRRKSRLAAKL